MYSPTHIRSISNRSPEGRCRWIVERGWRSPATAGNDTHPAAYVPACRSPQNFPQHFQAVTGHLKADLPGQALAELGIELVQKATIESGR